MKNKKRKNKLLATLLSFMLIITAMPFTPLSFEAHAAENVTLEQKTPMTITQDTTLKDIEIKAPAGESAVLIKGNVTLTIEGTVRLTGGDGVVVGKSGGAGIEVPESSSLTLKGSGTLYATGGRAANGQEGADGVVSEIILQCKGYGGGGAGAGIGGRGARSASSSDKSASAGSINIADKNLTVYATGGAGGEKGGKGGKGCWDFRTDIDVVHGLIAVTEYEQCGGQGGQGGGGSGFPAAGIGSGGAAGGDGGSGNGGTYDSGTCTSVMYIPPFYDVYPGWLQVVGGAGGGGGAGYASGGGGGVGTSSSGEVTAASMGNMIGFYEWVAMADFTEGGESGQPGVESYPSTFQHKSNTVVAPKPGNAGGYLTGGAGGAKGTALNGKKEGGAGIKGGNAGNRSSSGTFTLTAGNVSAKSGGGNARSIGCGDGAGAEKGTAIIRGGNLNTNDSGKLNLTNGAQKVYPVTLRPARYHGGVDVFADLTVNDKDAGVSRFFDEADGTVTLWLPSSDEPYYVNYIQPVKTEYEVTVKAGVVSQKLLTEIVTEINLADGDVVFYSDYYKQGSSTGAYTKKAIVYGGKASVSYTPGAGEHTLIMQNAQIKDLHISDVYGSTAKLNLQAEGEGNAVDTIYIVDPNSNVRFTGDVNSRLNISDVSGFKSNYAYTRYLFVPVFYYYKEFVVSSAKTEAAAKKQLTDNGYTLVENLNNYNKTTNLINNAGDMNLGAGGQYIYIGYKTTQNVNEAITGLVVADTTGSTPASTITDTKTVDGKSITYKADKVKNIGDNGDLNKGAGGADLFLYQTRDKNFLPLTGVMTLLTKDFSEGDLNNSSDCNCSYVKYKGSNEPANCNKGTKKHSAEYGDPAIVIARNTAVHEKQTMSYSKDYHAGSVVMDSFGIVNIGRLGGDIVSEKLNDAYSALIHGTPSVEVNSGFLRVENPYPDWNSFLSRGEYTEIYILWCSGHYHNYSTVANWEGLYSKSYSNKLGDIRVNGGTLEVGSNGSGTLTVPKSGKSKATNETRNVDMSGITPPNITVATGGSLLSADAPGVDAEFLKTVSDLPANKHLSLVYDPADSLIGDYTNVDIWTNDNGSFTTYIRTKDDGKTITVADLEEGVRYTYQITCNAYRSEIVKVEEASNILPGGNVDLYQHFYTYEDRQIKDYNSGEALNVAEDLLTLDVMKNTVAALESEEIRSIEKLTGQGEITLKGAGFTFADSVDVAKLTVQSGAVEMPSASSELIILGGSVKTDSPIHGAQGADGAVYQAVLPLWSADVKVDGKAYPGLNGAGHSDGKAYLYIPADAKLIEAGGRAFFAAFDNETQTMKLTERHNGDGKIDLSVSSAEVLDSELYIYNGNVYLNTNGTKYEVTGKSNVNTLTVNDGSFDITLKNVDVTSAVDSPITFTQGVEAVIHLEGENTLAGGEKTPAIRVPEGAKLTIDGSGVLNAGAGLAAAVIGGARGEVNGNITINGGTLNLDDNQTAAVGAGGGVQTPENSVTVNGGSVRSSGLAGAFGTTPVNANSEALNRLIIPGDKDSAVKVDGESYNVTQPNNDGKLYLYVPSDRHIVTVGEKDYLVVPLNSAVTGSGGTAFDLVEDDGTFKRLQNGDMLVEGTNVRITTTADKDWGLAEGLYSGVYTLREENNSLMLVPVSGNNDSAYWNGWEAIMEEDEDGETFTAKGLRHEVNKALQQLVGVSTQGVNVLNCTAAGEGLTMEILVDGEAVNTIALTDAMQAVTYEWSSDGGETVALRFTGTGKVSLEKIYLSAKADVSNVNTVFEKAYTITLQHPEATESECEGFLEILGENGSRWTDRNPDEPGEQILAGETAKIVYRDYDGGKIFDEFTLTYADSTSVKKTTNPLTLTAGEGDFTKNLTVSVTAHDHPYYVVIIPENAIVNDDGTGKMNITAPVLKNMQPGDTVDVTIGGLDENGGKTLTRVGADDTLTVTVTDGEDVALANGKLAAQFADNSSTPVQGGTICFGEPVGTRKAGLYTGIITFIIAYTAGN